MNHQSDQNKRYKLRFHLAKGRNFMKWQLTHPDGKKTYHDPENTRFQLWGCKFKNHRSTAEKIHAGCNKTVCAWVEAVDVKFLKNTYTDVFGPRIVYNPRIKPYWHFESDPDYSIDDHMMLALETDNCNIYQL